jgi:hypothetical protein
MREFVAAVDRIPAADYDHREGRSAIGLSEVS